MNPKAKKAAVIMIDPPAGFTPPQSDESDGSFDIVDTWKPTKDGKLCLVRMGDQELPDADDEGGDSGQRYKPSYKQMAQNLTGGSAMSGGDPGGPMG